MNIRTVLFASAVVACGAPANAAWISGNATAIDGDTLKIGEDKIRLLGIDAPEKKQMCNAAGGMQYSCGLVAKYALAEIVSKGPIRCEYEKRDKYYRIIAVCHVTVAGVSEVDVGWVMVSEGCAAAYPQYSKRYVEVEKTARERKIGIWAGEFDMPWEWRKSR